MKFRNRFKIAMDLLRGKTVDAERILTRSLDIPIGSMGVFGGLTEAGRHQILEKVTIKDLEGERLETLLPKIIKSDPAIDQAVNFFTTLVTQQHGITAESSRGDQAIADIIGMLTEKKNPLSLHVAHCASSLIMRGDICIETEFTSEQMPENLWVADPLLVEWRLVSGGGMERWALGHYSESVWQEIDSPNVFYLSGDPLIGERSSRSPLQTALFPAISQSAMMRSLQSIIDIHAWAQTVFSVKKLKLIELENEGANIDNVNDQIRTAMELITSQLANKKPEQIMGVTDDIEPLQLPGAGGNLSWTKEIGSLLDKRVAMGTKTPSTVGGPAERADYSTKEQGLFYSAYLQSSQERIGQCIEWAFTRFLRSMGITDKPVYASKSVNVQARMIEAQTFQEIMKGITEATKAGLPLPVAIAFFEEESGQTFSADLKSKIESEWTPPAAGGMGAANMDHPAAQENRYLATAIVEYLQKKKKPR